MRSTHSHRLERWLGTARIEQLSRSMKGWYGPPIHLLDCPGSVRLCGDGDFIGPFERGMFFSALDALEAAVRRAAKMPQSTCYAGFSSISDALSRATQGFTIYPGGSFKKIGPTGVLAVTSSLHKVGPQPAARVAAAAAPGGTAYVDTDTGGVIFANPAVGTTRLVGADVCASVINNSLLLYDRIFAVAKTMASTATQAVTGVPLRYQSTTATDENYIGGNFGFFEVGFTA